MQSAIVDIGEIEDKCVRAAHCLAGADRRFIGLVDARTDLDKGIRHEL